MSGISAQGSKLEIGSTAGAAQNITAITVGFPAIVTIAAHGRINGDEITIAGVTGTMGTVLNGLKFILANKTTNTFALPTVDTTGLTYTSGGTATPTTRTKINGVISFDGFDGTADELDTTDLDSTAKEFISGIKDEGKFGFEAKTLKADNGQNALRAARTSGAVVPMWLTLPDTSVASFNVIVKSMPTGGGVNAVLKGKIDCRISGPVSWA